MILGTVSEYIEGEGVQIIIDGEETSTIKTYKFLSSYKPEINDRVLIEEISGSYVVIGKIVDQSISTDSYTLGSNQRGNQVKLYDGEGTEISSVTVDRTNKLQAYSYNGYVEFTYFNGDLWVKFDGGTQFALAKK